MEIPHTRLTPETLRTLIEIFVMREGTDYGHQEHDLETKVAQVMRQLNRNEAVVLFDPDTESFTIQARGRRS